MMYSDGKYAPSNCSALEARLGWIVYVGVAIWEFKRLGGFSTFGNVLVLGGELTGAFTSAEGLRLLP